MHPPGIRDVDIERAESAGMRDLRMVMADLLARDMPGAADDFPWPLLMHDGAHILHVNPACLRWLDSSGEGALVGQPLDVLCAPEDRLSLVAALGATEREPPPTAHVQRFRSQNGATLIGRVLSRRKRFGEATATFALVQPGTTDRSFELLRLLGEAVDHLTDIIFITEAHAIDGIGRRIVFVNRAFTQASGFEASEVLGKTPNITIGVGTDREALSRIEAGLRETRAIREDLLKYAKDGMPYWVELQIIPVFDEVGVHAYWVSIQRDITARKKLEARVLESARLAAAGTLSASLAGELNSPLASVVSSLEWLNERLPRLLSRLGAAAAPEANEVYEALADARDGAARVAAATHYLELLGSTSAPRRHAVRVEEVLEGAVLDAERQLGHPLRVTRSYESHLLAIADPVRLAHALRLALTNAVMADKAARPVKLQLSATQACVCIGIEDEGPGIGPELSGELDEPFRLRRPRGIGDGLALFVASRLVAEVDGELVLLPRKDGGTRVEVRLLREH